MVPLSELCERDKGRIVKIHFGRVFRRKMSELGFEKGAKIKVIKKQRCGPMIVEIIGRGKYALGRGEAEKILVELGD